MQGASAAKELTELSRLLSIFYFQAGQFILKYLQFILISDWKLSVLTCYLFAEIPRVASQTALLIFFLSN